MPNHCWNQLNVVGSKEAVDAFGKKYINQKQDEYKDKFLDFEKVIPMPQGLDVKKSSYAEELYNLLYRIKEVEKNPSLLQDNFSLYFILSELKEKGKTPEEAAAEIIEKFPEAKELAEQYHSNFQKFGATDWYEWRVKYWNTKWNSYDCYVMDVGDGIAITFSTAWSPCTPVVKKLIEDNPELTFIYEYDEPGMQFRGSMDGSNGQVTKDHYEEYEYQEEEEENEEDE